MSVLKAAERVRFLVDGVAPTSAREPVNDPEVWKAIRARQERAQQASEVLKRWNSNTCRPGDVHYIDNGPRKRKAAEVLRRVPAGITTIGINLDEQEAMAELKREREIVRERTHRTGPV